MTEKRGRRAKSAKLPKCDCEHPLENVTVTVAPFEGLSIVFPLPHDRLAPNGSRRAPIGWIARLTRERRADSRLATMAAMLRQFGKAKPGGFPWPKARIGFHFVLPRKRNPDNLIAWMKATIDGIQDAGVVVDDQDFELGLVTQESGRDLRHCVAVCIERI